MWIGIEIGGTKLQVIVAESPTEPRETIKLSVDSHAGAEGIRNQLRESIPALVTRWHPVGIGVGFGGPVDWREGKVGCSHQVEGWGEFPLAAWLEELSGIPVQVENDANTAALGESLYGAGKGANPSFWINMGSGVGGGLVLNGAIYHGAVPGEAEVGHLRLDKSGVTVEERCSGWAVDRAICAEIKNHPESLLARLCAESPGAEARHLAPALAKGDPLAEKVIAELGDNLGFALSHVTHLFHPEKIVMGGGVSLVGEPVRAAVAAALPKYLMKLFQPAPVVVLAALGELAVPVGAIAIAQLRAH